MYVCIYIYIFCVYIWVYIYTNIYICIYIIYTYVHIDLSNKISVFTCGRVMMNVCTYVRARICICVNTYIYMHMRVYLHIYIYIYIETSHVSKYLQPLRGQRMPRAPTASVSKDYYARTRSSQRSARTYRGCKQVVWQDWWWPWRNAK